LVIWIKDCDKMELIKLELEGFGKFAKKKTIHFKKGVNFISGLNEAGKSTLLEAIMASIFKFNKREIEPFFCWNNHHICKVALTYKTDKGEIFRITSDYKNNRRRLEKITKSGSKEISSVDKNINPYIKEHFGFDDKKVFENTAFIRQSQMAILEDHTIKNKIKDMIEEIFAGRAKASATKAIQKIKKYSKDASKEIEKLKEEKLELEDELEDAQNIKLSLSRDSAEYEKVSKELKEKQKKLEKLEESSKKFKEKEKLQEDKEIVTAQIKKIDKLLLSIDDILKKIENIKEELIKFRGYDKINKENYLEIKEIINKLNELRAEEKTISKTDFKETIINEKISLKHLGLIVIGVILSLTLIGAIAGIPLIIYSSKRLKIKEEIVVSDKKEEKLKEINDSIQKYQQSLEKLTTTIRNFKEDTFLESYSRYTFLMQELRNNKETLNDLIKSEIESDEMEENINLNIKKVREKKLSLLNRLAIIENNLKEYKLINLTQKDVDELNHLKEEVEKLKSRKIELQTSVRTTTSLVESPEEIKEKLDAVEEKIKELNNKIQEHNLASKFLEMAETAVHHKFTPAVEKDSKPILKLVTNEHYNELKIDEETLDIYIKAPEIKKFINVSMLSQGARDQIYFTLRTVMVNLLSGNLNIPLILDDPFHNFDEVRLKKTINVIKKLSKEKQIILTSHRPYHNEFKNFVTNIIELK